MKPVIAALLIATAAVAVHAAPASAESSYWEKRWRSRDATPEYSRPKYRRAEDGRRVVVRRRYVDRRIAPRPRPRYVERYEAYGDAVPRPFRVERNDGRAHPTMNNDYWVQSSIYDFQAGKAADLKSYRY